MFLELIISASTNSGYGEQFRPSIGVRIKEYNIYCIIPFPSELQNEIVRYNNVLANTVKPVYNSHQRTAKSGCYLVQVAAIHR